MPRIGTVFKGTAVTLASCAAALLVAQAALLPATRCLVNRDAIDGLAMPQSYAEVRDKLGCDGKLAGRDDWGAIVRERYRWRGDVWPFGMFEGLFYNDQLHGKDVRWISINLSLAPTAVQAATHGSLAE